MNGRNDKQWHDTNGRELSQKVEIVYEFWLCHCQKSLIVGFGVI